MLMAVAEFERLFREAASLDVDKDDLKRVSDFLTKKIYDLLVVAEKAAKYNARDIIYRPDLPITKGLEETIHQFERMDVALRLEPVLEQLAKLPPLDLEVGDDVREILPKVAGALVVALAKVLKEIDPKLKNPQSEHWARAERIFDLLL